VHRVGGSAAAVAAPDAKGSFLKNAGFEEGATNWVKSGNAADMDSHQWRYHEGKSCFGFGNDEGPPGAYGEAAQEVEISRRATWSRETSWSQRVDAERGPVRRKGPPWLYEFLDADGQPWPPSRA